MLGQMGAGEVHLSKEEAELLGEDIRRPHAGWSSGTVVQGIEIGALALSEVIFAQRR